MPNMSILKSQFSRYSNDHSGIYKQLIAHPCDVIGRKVIMPDTVEVNSPIQKRFLSQYFYPPSLKAIKEQIFFSYLNIFLPKALNY